MTQPFSFPYPVLQATPRPVGQGCNTCVHTTYCPALYWFRRGGDSRGFKEEPVDDRHMGIQCASWSNNPADMVKTVNERDLDENQYIWDQGIGSEPNRSGITDQSGGSWRRP